MVTPEITDQLPFDADLLAQIQAIDAPAAALIAGFMAGHATGSMKLWDDGVLASMLDEDVISYGDPGDDIHPSDDVDPTGLEALLLDLWSENP